MDAQEQQDLATIRRVADAQPADLTPDEAGHLVVGNPDATEVVRVEEDPPCSGLYSVRVYWQTMAGLDLNRHLDNDLSREEAIALGREERRRLDTPAVRPTFGDLLQSSKRKGGKR